MRYIALLVLIILSPFCGIVAEACSPASIVWYGHDDYSHYNAPKWGFDPLSDESYVALVRAKNRKTRRVKSNDFGRLYDAPRNGEKFPDKTYEFEFEIIETLKGNPEFDQRLIAPKMTKSKIEMENDFAATPKTFDFWDGFDLTTPESDWYGARTSCGPMGDTALQKNGLYLVFGNGPKPIYFEQMSGLDDPLLSEFRRVFSGAPEHALLRTPENFFRQMVGYKSFEIISCPFGKYDFEERIIKIGEKTHNIWEPSDDTKSVFEGSINLREDFNSSHDIDVRNYLLKVECAVGAQYLVLERLYKPTRPSFGFSVPEPKHRFVKIENGQIYTRSIESRIAIKEPHLIFVEQVKTWIKEGREAAGTTSE